MVRALGGATAARGARAASASTVTRQFAIPGARPGVPAGEAAPLVLVSKARPLFKLEAKAVSGSDADAVHDMRVASRRLREALQLFEQLYPPKEFARFYGMVRTVTKELGAVRDSDVMIDAMSPLVADPTSDAERIALAYIIARRQAQREASLVRARKRIGSLDLGKARDRFERFAKKPRKSKLARRSLWVLAREAIAPRLDTAFGFLPAALAPENVESQHAMRIAFKRLRYAVETFSSCLGERFVESHRVLVAYQDALGELHDHDVFIGRVREAQGSADAQRAGVSPEGFDEVLAALEILRAKRFVRFRSVVRSHPEALVRRQITVALADAAPPAQPPPLGAGGTAA